MFKTHHVFALMACIVSSATAPVMVKADWSGNISGEQIIDGANKGSRIRFEMSNDDRPFDQSVYADYLDFDNTGSGFAVGYEPRYWFSDKFYVFGTGSVQTTGDDIIDYTRSLGGGLGAELINTDFQELSATIGARQFVSKIDDDVEFIGGDTLKTNTSFVTLSGEQQVSDFFKLGLDLAYSIGESSKTSAATAGIKLRIPGGGSIVYNYSVQNIDPDVGESTETTGSSISLEYDF